MKHSISVIIPTIGRETLHTLVRQVRQQLPNTQIIVSMDRRRAIDIPEATNILTDETRSPAKARNRGAAIAKGSVFVFLDDDMSVSEDWADNLMRLLNDAESRPSLWAFAIGNSANPSRAEQQEGVKWFGGTPRYLGPREFGAAGHFAISADAFRRLGGMNELFGNAQSYARNEDVELCCRARVNGVAVKWEPSVVAYHLGRNPLSAHEHFEQGRADAKVDMTYFRGMFVAKLLREVGVTILSRIFHVTVEQTSRANGYLFETVALGLVTIAMKRNK
jgi:glycosyltransferase involved in cell wall biosynthesis